MIVSNQVLSTSSFTELMKAVLEKGTPFRFQANGFSMFPFIRNNDVLTISPPSNHLRLGDIVAFHNTCNGKLAVHRIIGIIHHGYLVRGDNSPEADGIIRQSDIYGQVIRLERRGHQVWFGFGPERRIIAFLSRYNLLLLLMFPVNKLFSLFNRSQA